MTLYDKSSSNVFSKFLNKEWREYSFRNDQMIDYLNNFC